MKHRRRPDSLRYYGIQFAKLTSYHFFCSGIIQGSLFMFAASTLSRMYHLVRSGTAETLCGLQARMIVQSEPVSSALHLVSKEPSGYVPCKQCECSPEVSHLRTGPQTKPDDRRSQWG